MQLSLPRASFLAQSRRSVHRRKGGCVLRSREAKQGRVTPQRSRGGFTLIELSIVLVVIGLIVGGILVGRDLIHAARIRSAISQIEKYDVAVMTFRGKFGALPGDIPAAKAAQFGFQSRSGATHHGDGNFQIYSCSGQIYNIGCETGLFWRDLYETGLIGDSLDQATDANATSVNSDQLDGYLPASKLGNGNRVRIIHTTPLEKIFITFMLLIL